MDRYVTVTNPWTCLAVAIINHIGKDMQQVNWIYLGAANGIEFSNLAHFMNPI